VFRIAPKIFRYILAPFIDATKLLLLVVVVVVVEEEEEEVIEV